MLKVLDLFSGIGGFSLGLERTGGFETVAFCEIDPFCCKVLGKHWPDVPIFGDIRELKGEHVGPVDVVCGGYPCQPFSHAGQRRGAEDDRHLWPEMYRLVDELRPAWVIGENVAGHVSMGLDDVLSDLEAIGYAARPFVIPACAVDARHRRDRVWTVAHASGTRSRDFTRPPTNERWQRASIGPEALRQRNRSKRAIRLEPASEDVAHASRLQPGRQDQRPERERTGASGQSSDVPDAEGIAVRAGLRRGEPQQHGDEPADRGRSLADSIKPGLEGYAGDGDRGDQSGRIEAGPDGPARPPRLSLSDDGCRRCEGPGRSKRGGTEPARWLPEPDVGRVAHGVPNRVDRLKALGNAVVPQVVEMIGRAILEAEEDRLSQ